MQLSKTHKTEKTRENLVEELTDKGTGPSIGTSLNVLELMIKTLQKYELLLTIVLIIPILLIRIEEEMCECEHTSASLAP